MYILNLYKGTCQLYLSDARKGKQLPNNFPSTYPCTYAFWREYCSWSSHISPFSIVYDINSTFSVLQAMATLKPHILFSIKMSGHYKPIMLWLSDYGLYQ